MPSRSTNLAPGIVVLTALFLPAGWSGQQIANLAASNYSGGLNGTFAIVILALLAIGALLAALEGAISALRASHLRGSRSGEAGDRLGCFLSDRSRYAATAVVGTAAVGWLAILSCFAVAPSVLVVFGSQSASATGVLATGAALSLVVSVAGLFVQAAARGLGVAHPVRVLQRFGGVLLVLAVALAPLVSLVRRVHDGSARRPGTDAAGGGASLAEEDIKNLVDSAEESGEMEQEERKLLHSVFEFGDTVAREVMTPRVDLDALPITATPQEILQLIQESGHSRIPLYEGTDDQIVGLVHAKDLLKFALTGEPVNIRSILRPVIFVPETKSIHDLLTDLRLARSQMAVVQDEFGGTSGIVTIEDIVEELVGDIVDEYDVEEPELIANGQGYLVNAKMNLHDLNEAIGTDFESDEFDTVGGYVFGLFGRQPQVGETIEEGPYRFRIEKTDGRRIQMVHLERIDEADEAASTASRSPA